MNDISQLKNCIINSKKICVFTGAGISCASGIPDFRSDNGLYNSTNNYNYSPEEIISHSFFINHPEMFFDFYKNKMVYKDAKPNAAHKYFANLEKTGKKISIVTQNIDGLHTMAGSSDVVELHGNVYRNYCTVCGKSYGIEKILSSDEIPKCDIDGGIIKPDVVLYEEPLNNYTVDKAIKRISSADLLIIIGSSLVVYPAASYIRYFKGKTLALINKTKTDYDNMANIKIYDDIINVIKAIE